MDFDDYGWTALAIDGDEESDEAAKGASVSLIMLYMQHLK